ncbi:MAG: diacylglycerol kinase family lipid kinase [Clostridia bacterium]|nr:diacylglycerol kinase family lipid kinase [Clostridia bacterium]
MNRNVFILNPKAGFRKLEEWKALIAAKFGENAIIRLTERAGHATEIAKEYTNSTIFAVGGDGTVNEVMNGLVGSDNTLCILPAGSGNDFVRTLYKDIPKKKRTVKGILERIETLKPKKIDCSSANGSYFMNIASVGFDAEVVRNSERYENIPGLRKLSYIISIFYTIFHYRGIDLKGEIDGIPFEQKSLLLCVANGKYYGGGVKIAPEAEFDDGKLDAYLIESVSPMRFLSVLPKLAAGTHTKLRFVKHFKADKVTLQGENLTLNLDGELSPTQEAAFQVIPGGITVLAPEPSIPQIS